MSKVYLVDKKSRNLGTFWLHWSVKHSLTSLKQCADPDTWYLPDLNWLGPHGDGILQANELSTAYGIPNHGSTHAPHCRYNFLTLSPMVISAHALWHSSRKQLIFLCFWRICQMPNSAISTIPLLVSLHLRFTAPWNHLLRYQSEIGSNRNGPIWCERLRPVRHLQHQPDLTKLYNYHGKLQKIHKSKISCFGVVYGTLELYVKQLPFVVFQNPPNILWGGD